MIELKNISKTYFNGKVSVEALKDISLNIQTGEFVAIMGPSGSGKSTLLHLLGFLDRPDKGTYKILDNEISKLSDDELAILRNNLCGFVFQQFHLLRRVDALENIELPLIYAGKKQIKDKAFKKLEAVGLASRQKHNPNELSGGEQQRVAIARALVNEPLIIFADEPTGNLDTKSEEEIIKILKELNDQGKTIIMVTHENEIAQHAKRIIRMRDGEIESDETKNNNLKQQKDNIKNASISINRLLSSSHSVIAKVEFIEHVKQSFRAIFANKVRSFLSVLGILFGVGAVIAMLALGQGAQESLEANMKSLGSNLLYLRGGSAKIRGAAQGTGSVTRFTMSDVEAIRKLSPIVNKSCGYVSGGGQVIYGNENWGTRIEGVGYDYGEMRDSIPEVGRWFEKSEYAKRDKVAIIGFTVVEKLFNNKNPIGQTIKINRINFRVIGVIPEKGARGFHDQDDVVCIPVTTAMYRVLGKDYLDAIYIEVNDVKYTEEAKKDITVLIKNRHKLYSQNDDSFHIRDMSEIQDMLSATTKTMSMLLGSIAAISLLVGGIGIMNIMLVSVTERTREIGLRKAVGARSVDIMTQFLIEAVAMTVSGGLMGIALGAGVAFALSVFAGWSTKVSLFSVILATTFSIAVGIGFGIWPARKAARLNPIEALRYE